MSERHEIPPPKLLDRLRAKTRLLHYSVRTEEAYVAWVTRFILFHHKRHPKDMGAPKVEAFLTHLASDRRLAASTQNQAFSAILFLYQKVLGLELPEVEFLRAKCPERLPVVLSVDEVRAVLGRMAGTHQLLAELMYGSGLRVLECCRLRVKDVDFDRHQIAVRDGKGGKDRVVPLPRRLEAKLRAQLADAKALHARDLPAGHGRVWLPYAYAAKWPGADREFAWQYLFPSSKLSADPRADAPDADAVPRRHHLHENTI